MSSVALVDEAASKVDSLEVTFRDQPLPRLSAWTGKIWNAGQQPLRSDDIRNLRFSIQDGKPLGAWVEAVSHAENDVGMVTVLDGDVRLNWNFLNSGDGAEVTILHTGPPNRDPVVNGAVVGGDVKRAIYNGRAISRFGVREFLLGLALSLGLPLIAAFSLAIADGQLLEIPEVREAYLTHLTSWPIVAAFVLFPMLWIFVSAVEVRRRVERSSEPMNMKRVRGS